MYHLGVLLITAASAFKYFNNWYILLLACPGAFFFLEMAVLKNENRIPAQSAFKLPGDTWVLPPLQIWVSMAFGDWDACPAFPSKFDWLKLGSLGKIIFQVRTLKIIP